MVEVFAATNATVQGGVKSAVPMQSTKDLKMELLGRKSEATDIVHQTIEQGSEWLNKCVVDFAQQTFVDEPEN